MFCCVPLYGDPNPPLFLSWHSNVISREGVRRDGRLLRLQGPPRMRVQSHISLDFSGIQEGFLDPVDIRTAV